MYAINNPQQQPDNSNLYQFPQQFPQPQRTGDNSLDSASKLLDIIERMNSRRSGTNFEPGQSQQSQFNTGMFQTMPQQELARQEMMLRNPQAFQQQQTLQPPQVGQQQNANIANLMAQIQQAAQLSNQTNQQQRVLGDSAMQAYNALAALINPLADYAQVGEVTNVLANEQAKMIDALYPYSVLAPMSQDLANHFYEELQTAHEVIQIQQMMMQHPLVLTELAFNCWMSTVDADDEEFISAISELYMRLVNVFEEQVKAKTGQYSPTYSQYLQSEVNQQNPRIQQFPAMQPGNAQNSPQQVQDTTSALKAFSQALNQPGFGKQLQRQHSMIRDQQRRRV